MCIYYKLNDLDTIAKRDDEDNIPYIYDKCRHNWASDNIHLVAERLVLMDGRKTDVCQEISVDEALYFVNQQECGYVNR